MQEQLISFLLLCQNKQLDPEKLNQLMGVQFNRPGFEFIKTNAIAENNNPPNMELAKPVINGSELEPRMGKVSNEYSFFKPSSQKNETTLQSKILHFIRGRTKIML